MVVLRVLGRLLIILSMMIFFGALAVWLLGADVTQPTGKAWYQAHVASLNFFQVIIQRHLHLPGVWDSIIVPYLLARPFWEAIIIVFVMFLVLGALCIRIGQPRQRRPGFS